ncbi:MAG TPA: anaerobic ribonucleoside-triphosphate reductase activating protein [Clostridia bacterium]|nr:anaerobic ribonucleoside-triphosphate reductase activating protein [Clostridia bacterium]
MKLAGLIKSSTLDYPGALSAVFFFPGCNYDCFYCHNRDILHGEGIGMDVNEALAFLEKRKGLLDAVVLSGGEAALQKGLKELALTLKSMGFLVKLDTNGSLPEAVSSMLASNALDYVALDYKAPWSRYHEIAGNGANAEQVKETASLLFASSISFEARTTVIPQLSLSDMLVMAREMPPLPRYVLNPYRMPPSYRQEDLFRLKKPPHLPETLLAFAEAIKPFQPNVVAY